MFRSTWPFLVAAGIAVAAASSVHAADALTVELDGARILKLDNPASDIVVGNPNVADVTVQTPNRLVIIGRAPGITRLIIMNDGTITMDTQVVVTAKNASAQVSVLAPDGGNVTETIFACGDRCTVVPGTKRTSAGGGGGGGGSNGGGGPIPTEPTVDQLPPPSPGGGPSY
ncbi:pilus assembly protein N-terminal domain-containing protein [Dongia deserti]|uniref:pilus assembly protein N-terminal domain-containing protein n=1 Tax=Dongia deserti TaxID=2268030 RepID=UPI0013C52F34|nr:pilus assembly protein N-terminal domain-containing protein [Dongia deserti]